MCKAAADSNLPVHGSVIMLLSPSNQCGGSSSGLLKCLPSSLDIFDAAVQLPMGRSRLSSFLLYYIFVILSTPFSFFLTIFSQFLHNPQKKFHFQKALSSHNLAKNGNGNSRRRHGNDSGSFIFLRENIVYRRNKFGRILAGQFVKIFMIKILKLFIGNAVVKERI